MNGSFGSWLAATAIVAAAAAISLTSASASFVGCARQNWMCDSGQCVQSAYLCDGENDCPGGEDESKDVCGDCPQTSFYCPSSRRCINYLFMCDGSPHCPRAEDESSDRCFDVPARLEGVTCNATALSVRVRARSADEKVYIYNSACSLENKAGRTHEGAFALRDCGISRRVEGTTLVYYADLIAVAGGDEIVDEDDTLRRVECRYKANVTKTNGVSFEPAAAGGSTKLPPLVGSPRSNVTGVVMRQYPTAAFDAPYDEAAYPLQLHIGSLMYIQVKALGDADAVQLSLKSCTARGSVGGEQRLHQLVRDGCIVSKSFVPLMSPSSSDLRFTLKAFSLIGGSGPVYLDCEVGICDQGSELCGGCQSGGGGAARGRRSAAWAAAYSRVYAASLGPIVWP